MNGRCGDCRWFAAPELTDKYHPAPDNWQACGLTASTLGKPEQSTALAMALDGEARGAELLVSPDWGCVQFEGER